jgi:hypothetical protein
MANFYDTEIERFIQLHYSRLSEKDRRQYAAIEAEKLGFGGKMYISKLLSMSRRTLNKGILELKNEKIYEEIPIGKQRRVGGGRKKNLQNSQH